MFTLNLEIWAGVCQKPLDVLVSPWQSQLAFNLFLRSILRVISIETLIFLFIKRSSFRPFAAIHYYLLVAISIEMLCALFTVYVDHTISYEKSHTHCGFFF